MIRVLGLSAKRGGGKDSTAAFLLAHSRSLFPGWTAVRVGIADPIKEYLISKWGAVREIAYGTDEEKEAPLPLAPHLTYRQGCKLYGDMLQEFDPLYLAKEFAATVGRQAQAYPRLMVVCTDVRFPREVWGIKRDLWALGREHLPRRPIDGRVFRLTRVGRADAHHTETALDDMEDVFDAVIDNSRMCVEARNAHVLMVLKHWGWIEETALVA